MPDIRETPLPGVGARFDFDSAGGRRIGVITRRSGRRELIVYDRRDPDAVAATVELSPDESRTLAELLGGATVTEQLRSVVQQVDGLTIDWISLSPTFAARTLGEVDLRLETGASVIALVRDDVPLPAPGAESELRGGDVVVLTGTPEGIDRAARLLGVPGS